MNSILGVVLALGVLASAAQEKSIKEVMSATHKGKESIVAKINEGKGTDEDAKKLLAAYTALSGFKAPMGDEKSWKEKTEAGVAAAKDLVEKKAGAAEKVKAATNCKACHSLHRPPEKK